MTDKREQANALATALKLNRVVSIAEFRIHVLTWCTLAATCCKHIALVSRLNSSSQISLSISQPINASMVRWHFHYTQWQKQINNNSGPMDLTYITVWVSVWPHLRDLRDVHNLLTAIIWAADIKYLLNLAVMLAARVPVSLWSINRMLAHVMQR